MPTHQPMDNEWLAKYGFLLGLGLFLVGGLAELTIHGTGLAVPAWEEALFLDMEILGVLLGVLCPFVFGIALPLTE